MTKKINEKLSEKPLEVDLEKRLDTIISILLNSEIIKDTQLKKIEFLTRMLFSNDEIAKILATTKNSVEAQKYKKPKPKKDLGKSKKK